MQTAMTAPAPEPVVEEPVEDDETTPARNLKWLRLVVLAALLVGLWVLADRMGWRDSLTQEGIQEMVQGAGVWGVLAFVAAFVVGQLAQVPGSAFIVAASVAWGTELGFVAGYLGALAASLVSFMLVRTVGGTPLGTIKYAWVRRVLARLDTHPIRTVFVLRLLFALSPWLNYVLAMSDVKVRDYLAGSALGLVAPIALYIFFSDFILSIFAGIL